MPALFALQVTTPRSEATITEGKNKVVKISPLVTEGSIVDQAAKKYGEWIDKEVIKSGLKLFEQVGVPVT